MAASLSIGVKLKIFVGTFERRSRRSWSHDLAWGFRPRQPEYASYASPEPQNMTRNHPLAVSIP